MYVLDSQKLDSCNQGGLNLISKANNNNNSNNNRNRTTSSNYIINNNELPPSDDIDPHTVIKSERINRSSSRSQGEAEVDKLDEHEKSGMEESQESASENEGDNNNNEDDEREEGEVCDQDPSKMNSDKAKLYKKKKRRRRKREMTLKSDQNQQIDDDDDEMATIKESPLGDDNDGNLSDSYINRKHSVSITRRRHSSSSDPVNLSIGNKQSSHIDHDDSDEGNIDVETVSAPSKVSF